MALVAELRASILQEAFWILSQKEVGHSNQGLLTNGSILHKIENRMT